MKTKSIHIANSCRLTALQLADDNAATIIPVRSLVVDDQGNPRTRNSLSPLDMLAQTGIYAFVNEELEYCYIGQGGARASTPLKARIGQELRLYRPTGRGSNGATLSKNIQEIAGVRFNDEAEFKVYIAGWSIRIIHASRFQVSTELVEAFAIDLFEPFLNRAGRAEQVAPADRTTATRLRVG